MLGALANTARDLEVGFLIGAAIFACSVLAGLVLGRLIHDAEEAPEVVPLSEPQGPADLDDWLAHSEPFFEFELWECPKAEVHVRRRAA